MKHFHKLFYLMPFLLISLAACGTSAPPTEETEAASPAEESSSVTDADEAAVESSGVTDPDAATAEAEVAQNQPTFTPTATPEPTETHTPVPTATPSPAPTDTPTPTPEPEPVVRVNEDGPNLNIRSGPGTNYAVVGQFEPGQEAIVTGRNEEDSWWQVSLADETDPDAVGWVFANLVTLEGDDGEIAIAEAPPTPTPNPAAVAQAAESEAASAGGDDDEDEPETPQELEEQLRCGKDFCVTYQAMVPIWENGGCVGNHSIYITVLQGPPPGEPMSGVVIGDTFNNVEVASGSHGPGRTEITLWNNSMTLLAKRHQDGTPYTSEESFNFTSADELIPAEVLAANGYCDGSVDKCRWAQQNNQVCRGHYSWRVTFHKFD